MSDPSPSTPTLTAGDQLDRAQMAALIKRLKAGQPLTDKQLDQVKAYIAAQEAQAAGTPARKPGRPRRPVIPKLVAPATMRDAQKLILNEALDRQRAGKPLANHHARAIRDAWLLSDALYLWPDIAACAAELQVSISTVRAWAADGCPAIESHSPIPKPPVYQWMLAHVHTRGGERGGTTAQIEDVELRWRQAKLAKLEDSIAAEAEDRARQGVITVMTTVREHLKHQLPGAIYDAVAKHITDRNVAEDAVGQLIDHELHRLEPRPPTTTPATP